MQAIINMEEDGSFYLKNLGKRSISVNKKEVATGQRFRLTSCCLIEVCQLFVLSQHVEYGDFIWRVEYNLGLNLLSICIEYSVEIIFLYDYSLKNF